MPKTNVEYRRKHGNKDIVTVLGVSNDVVQIRDTDGRHFVTIKDFNEYFMEVEKSMEKFYGYDGQERLSSDAEDVVCNLMEDEKYEDFPIEVHVFEKREPFKNPQKSANSILEDILENLDENYGDPDSNGTEPTDNMKKASLELVRVLMEEYSVWACEPTGEILEFSKEEAEKIVGK